LDATHLAEFHQIEGLIADRSLTLGDLLGVMNVFFNKLGKNLNKCLDFTYFLNLNKGLTQLRFKPAYNPYTEPSLEIFAYHNGN
jgi:phenylalanyl-tRNA synthetase alpha chain